MIDIPENSPFFGAALKLKRARQNLNELLTVLEAANKGHCTITPEIDFDLEQTVLGISITPKAPAAVSAISGDMLFNLRSSLDHLVWALSSAPSTSNQFPITYTPAEYEEAVKRKRLRGVSKDAIAAIDSLQPYRAGNEALATLNRLHNTDKHQRLNVYTVVADSTSLLGNSLIDPALRMLYGGDDLKDGEIFGDIRIPFEVIPAERMKKFKLEGDCSLFVAFNEPEIFTDGATRRTEEVLEEILLFIEERVIGALRPFM